MNRYAETLTEARDTIDTPIKWCRKYLATDIQGSSTLPTQKESCKWCVAGAIHRVEGDPNARMPLYFFIEESIRREHKHLELYLEDDDDVIASFNDHPEIDHSEVIKVFNEAIKLSDSQPDLYVDSIDTGRI